MNANGMIFDAGKKATHTPNRNPHAERQGKQVAGTPRDAQEALRPLDGEEAADERSYNRLSTHQKERIVPMRQRESRFLKPIQRLAAHAAPAAAAAITHQRAPSSSTSPWRRLKTR